MWTNPHGAIHFRKHSPQSALQSAGAIVILIGYSVHCSDNLDYVLCHIRNLLGSAYNLTV